jgi:hypothetical protein
MPLETQGDMIGLFDAFIEKIPFNIGKRILEQISIDEIKNCNGSFEAFLEVYFERVAKFLDDSCKSQKIGDIVYEQSDKAQESESENKINQDLSLIANCEESSGEEHCSDMIEMNKRVLTKEQHFKNSV